MVLRPYISTLKAAMMKLIHASIFIINKGLLFFNYLPQKSLFLLNSFGYYPTNSKAASFTFLELVPI